MKFESSYVPASSPESSLSNKDKKDTKSKKTRADQPPAVSREDVRTLAGSAVSLEALVDAKLGDDKPEKTAKPEPGLSESLFRKPSKEADTGGEEDKTLENLDAEEQKTVAETYVVTVMPTVEAEAAAAEPDTAEQLEAAANMALLAELETRLAADATPEEALEDAYESVAQTLGTPAEAPVEYTAEGISTDAGAGEEDADVVSEETFSEADEPVAVRDAENAHTMPPTAEEDDDSDDQTATTSMPLNRTASSSTATSPPPPPPPVPPVSSAASPGSGGGNGPNGRSASPLTRAAAFAAGAGVGVAMGRASAERPVVYNTSQAPGLLVGGILGYLIGRRRGRIKTERRLLPVQKKLEKQVKDLHQAIAGKEHQIRKLAREKAETQTVSQKRQETVQRLQKEHRVSPAAAAERAKAASVVAMAEQSTVQAAAAEQALAAKAAAAPAEKPAQKAEEMNLATLLVVAESINVDRQPLRQLYESGHLDEQGLRRVIREHLRGGNVQETVARERIARELPFESDPQSRQKTATAAVPLAAPTVTTQSHDRSVLPGPVPPAVSVPSAGFDAHQPGAAPHETSAKTAITVIVVFGLALAVAALIL